MTRREFTERMAQIDPESEEAVDKLAALFEEDYLSSGKDLNGRYDELLEKIIGELRKAGATEAQINWGLFGNVELPTLSYIRCNAIAKKMIHVSYQITYCLGELKMLSKYTDVDMDALSRIQREYKRRFG